MIGKPRPKVTADNADPLMGHDFRANGYSCTRCGQLVGTITHENVHQ
jgi:hypothetical protein